MITEPGLYLMTNQAYHDDPAVSSTQLVAACRSMAHFYDVSPTNPDRPVKATSKQMEFGSAVHCALLEPEVFEETYLVAPVKEDYPGVMVNRDDLEAFCHRTGLSVKGNKQKLIFNIRAFGIDVPPIWDVITQEFKERAEGKNIISADDKARIGRMARRLQQEELEVPDGRVFRLADLLRVGQAEESFFWQDPDSGLMCRVRTDWRVAIPTWKIIIDFKSTQDSRRDLFSYSAENLYYWMRAAMYVDGLKAVTGETYDYILLAQESESPHLAQTFFYQQHNIEYGRALYKDLLMRVAECRRTRIYPGYGRKLQELFVSERIVKRHPVLEELAFGEA